MAAMLVASRVVDYLSPCASWRREGGGGEIVDVVVGKAVRCVAVVRVAVVEMAVVSFAYLRAVAPVVVLMSSS